MEATPRVNDNDPATGTVSGSLVAVGVFAVTVAADDRKPNGVATAAVTL